MKFVVLSPALLSLAAFVRASTVDFTTVTGYFLQDESSTDASTFDYVCISCSCSIFLNSISFPRIAIVVFGAGLANVLIDCCQLWPHQPYVSGGQRARQAGNEHSMGALLPPGQEVK